MQHLQPLHMREQRTSKDFYFSDSNLRRDRFMKQTLDNDGGYLDLNLVLTFNRIKAGLVEPCERAADLTPNAFQLPWYM